MKTCRNVYVPCGISLPSSARAWKLVEGGGASEVTISGVKLWSTVSACAHQEGRSEGPACPCAGWGGSPKISLSFRNSREFKQKIKNYGNHPGFTVFTFYSNFLPLARIHKEISDDTRCRGQGCRAAWGLPRLVTTGDWNGCRAWCSSLDDNRNS